MWLLPSWPERLRLSSSSDRFQRSDSARLVCSCHVGVSASSCASPGICAERMLLRVAQGFLKALCLMHVSGFGSMQSHDSSITVKLTKMKSPELHLKGECLNRSKRFEQVLKAGSRGL